MPTRMNTGLSILGGNILVADDHHITAFWGIRILTQPGFIPSANKALQLNSNIHLYMIFMDFPIKNSISGEFSDWKTSISREFSWISPPFDDTPDRHPPAPPLLAGSNGGKGRVLGAPGASSRRRRSCLSVGKPHPCDVLKVPTKWCPPVMLVG